MDKAIKTYIAVLKAEIAHLKTLLEPTEDKRLTGIPDTIVTLQRRVKELENGGERRECGVSITSTGRTWIK